MLRGTQTSKETTTPMTRALAIASVALLAAPPAFAQMGGPPQKITLATGLQRAYDGVKRNLTEMAEKMPEPAVGTMIQRAVCHFDAPQARLPARRCSGTVFIASSAIV